MKYQETSNLFIQAVKSLDDETVVEGEVKGGKVVAGDLTYTFPDDYHITFEDGTKGIFLIIANEAYPFSAEQFKKVTLKFKEINVEVEKLKLKNQQILDILNTIVDGIPDTKSLCTSIGSPLSGAAAWEAIKDGLKNDINKVFG